jgi:hypothetical protein
MSVCRRPIIAHRGISPGPPHGLGRVEGKTEALTVPIDFEHPKLFRPAPHIATCASTGAGAGPRSEREKIEE